MNVPDYPKLAQLWWQQIGDVNSGAFTPQEAMDRLASEMDQVMAGMQAADEQADLYGGCGPRLNEEQDAQFWFDQPGEPRPPLDNEKPQGETIAYDELVERWSSRQLGLTFQPAVDVVAGWRHFRVVSSPNLTARTTPVGHKSDPRATPPDIVDFILKLRCMCSKQVMFGSATSPDT